MKTNDVKASQNTIFLATIIDRLGLIYAWLTGTERPDPVVREFLGEGYQVDQKDKQENVISFDSPEEFIKVRYGEE